MNTDTATVYRVRADRVAWRSAGDEAVLLDVRQSVYFALDRSAVLLWPHLVAGATVAELAAVLAGHAPVGPDQAGADVRAFLADLESADLVDLESADRAGPESPDRAGPESPDLAGPGSPDPEPSGRSTAPDAHV